MGYLNSIKAAMLFFPVLALLITLPYMIINYRKYGSVNKLRTLILYSFILKIVNIGQGYWINRIILGMLYITVG